MRIVTISGCCFVCLLMACNSPQADQAFKTMAAHPTVVSNVLPDYYVDLFQQTAKAKIKSDGSIECIGRDTVCYFLYDQKYRLSLFTLTRSYDSSLQSSLIEKFSESDEEPGVSFYINAMSSAIIEQRMTDTAAKQSKIYVVFGGSGFSVNEKNDSVASYFFKCETLSIYFKPGSHQEIFVKNKDLIKIYIPLEVLFLKRGKRLFLALITTKDESEFPHSLGSSIFNLGKG
jgi:hypothetical protein